MKILCVSDTVVSQMENAAHLRRRYHDVDVLVSCGDMPASYLEYITSVLSIPLLYVRGNHDTGYDERPPGGIDLHAKLFEYHGVTFFGLEGSLKYNNSPVQYTQTEMDVMVMQSAPAVLAKRMFSRRGLDIFVTHAPPRGIHDLDDKPHQGFNAFLRFMDWYKPRYLVHGHVHTYDRRVVVETQYKSTRVMNINPVTLLEIAPE